MSSEQNPYKPPDSELVQRGGPPPDEMLSDFLGDAADYYLPKWEGLRSGTRSLAGFNWAAAFFSLLWLLYRKLYVWALGLLAVSFVLMALAPGFALPLRLAEFLLLGGLANVLLFRRATAVIAEASLRPEGEATAYVRKRGGTSDKVVWAAVALYLILLAIWFVAAIIPTL